jgi:hypothetical protein
VITNDYSTATITASDLVTISDENYDDANLYFGEEAKESFWGLYKSDRRFKDFD